MVLWHFDGQPLSNWPMAVTLNTLVGFIATFATVLVILAVTGALGQLKWNWFAAGPRVLGDMEIFESAGRTQWGVWYLLVGGKGW